jgi:hypothetical protein
MLLKTIKHTIVNSNHIIANLTSKTLKKYIPISYLQ